MGDLAFIAGPALGHFGRLYQVAMRLRDLANCRITIIRPDLDRFDPAIFPDNFEIVRLPAARDKPGLRALPFGDAMEELFADRRFDAIVQDCNPLGWLATTRLPDWPRINVTNVFLTRAAGLDTQQARTFERQVRPINAARAAKAMPPVQDVHELYEADAVLYADPGPILSLVPGLPEHHHGCGGCWWTYEGDVPAEIAGLDNFLLCSLGSTGRMPDVALFEAVAELFGCGDIVCVYTETGGERPETAGARRIHYFDRLPLAAVTARAGAVLSQGGAGSTYQALAAGKPMAIKPTHINHAILGDMVERLGAGIAADSKGRLPYADRDMGEEFRHGAQAAAAAMSDEDGASEIARRIAEIAAV